MILLVMLGAEISLLTIKLLTGGSQRMNHTEFSSSDITMTSGTAIHGAQRMNCTMTLVIP